MCLSVAPIVSVCICVLTRVCMYVCMYGCVITFDLKATAKSTQQQLEAVEGAISVDGATLDRKATHLTVLGDALHYSVDNGDLLFVRRLELVQLAA